MKTDKVTSKSVELKPYCYLARENDYIAVTEWANGEGFDVDLSANGENQRFGLTHGQFEALVVLAFIKEED